MGNGKEKWEADKKELKQKGNYCTVAKNKAKLLKKYLNGVVD